MKQEVKNLSSTHRGSDGESKLRPLTPPTAHSSPFIIIIIIQENPPPPGLQRGRSGGVLNGILIKNESITAATTRLKPK